MSTKGRRRILGMTQIEIAILAVLGCMTPCILSALKTQLSDRLSFTAPTVSITMASIPTLVPSIATDTAALSLIETKLSRIAFVSTEEWGGTKIFLINADGSGRTALTEIEGHYRHESDPVWSPDGKYIAFVDELCLYVSDLRTSQPRCLVDDYLRGPSWLRGGNQILYQAWDMQKQAARTYAINLDGSNKTLWLDQGEIFDLAWAPDGSKMAYVADEGIYVVNADGTGEKQLVSSGFDPSWSPDSRQLVFRDGNKLYAIGVDGTDWRLITDQAFSTSSPQWSPDGKTILFESGRDGNIEVYCINIDGTNLVRLTHNSAVDTDSIWSPDSKKIVFASDRGRDGDQYQLYLMNADGSDPTRLTHSDGRDARKPVWRPTG